MAAVLVAVPAAEEAAVAVALAAAVLAAAVLAAEVVLGRSCRVV